MRRATTALLLATAAIAAPPALADEGMWLPSQTDVIADDLRRAGLKLDPAKLGNLQPRR